MIIKPQNRKKLENVPKSLSEYTGLSEMSAKAELMLQGKVIKLDNYETLEDNLIEVRWYVCYILNVLNCGSSEQTYPVDFLPKFHEIWEHLQRYGEKKVRHIVVNTIEDMVMITFGLDDKEEPYHDDIDRDWIFSLVHNVTCPDFSEFGDTFYQAGKDNFYHRVG